MINLINPKSHNLKDVIYRYGLETNLKLCLDAGDGRSYTSGQKWLDLSGGGYDFFLGADGSSGTDDPTFNGVVNNQSPSEYFSCDGGDYFIYDSANETWMTDLHKGGDVSFLIVAYIVNVSSSTGLFGDYDSSVGAGSISGYVDSSGGKFRVRVADGIGLYGIGNAGPDLSSLAPGIIVIGVSHTPGSTTDYIIHINGTNYTATPGGYTPTMANPSQVFGVGTTGVIDGIIAQSSTRIYSFAAWQGGRLTSANFTSIWNAIRGRYGL